LSISKAYIKIQPIKRCLKIVLIICCVVVSKTQAQSTKDSLQSNKIVGVSQLASNGQIDVSNVFQKIFKSKKQTTDTTIASTTKNKKLYASFLPVAGYTLQTGFAILLNGSFAFYTDSSQKKLSNILTSIAYTQFHQIIFPLAATIWTKKNRYIISVDYRYLEYPSTNYGIGARTNESDAYTLNFNCIKLHQSILKKVANNLYAGLGFYYDHYWKIKEVDPPPGVRTSFEKYGNKKKSTAVAIALKVLYDSRENQINANNGAYASIIYRPNYKFLGSDNNWKSLQIDFRKYFRIGANPRNVLALWSFDWLTIGKGKPPYLLLPSTGWDDQYNTGRGYIQSRFRAKDFVYTEAEYRFGLSENGLLGAVVFVNAQSFSGSISTQQFSAIAPGYGAGLRIKLNKYSNTNLAIDYGFGQEGSKGIFLNLGEVF